MDVVPGQWWQRALAASFGAGSLWLFAVRHTYGLPSALLWICVVLFLVFALMSHAALYRRWMAFAEWSSVWVTRAVFSLIYLIVVPIVRVLQALSGRSRRDAGAGTSLWTPRRGQNPSLDDLERMG